MSRSQNVATPHHQGTSTNSVWQWIGRGQLRTFCLTYLTYGCFHAARSGFAGIKPALAADGFPNSLLAHLDSAFLFSYGCGLLVFGHVADRYSPKATLVAGTLAVALILALFALLGGGHSGSASPSAYLALRSLDGFFQATGMTCTVSIVGEWFGLEHRGAVFGLWTTNMNLGDIAGLHIDSFAFEAGPPLRWDRPLLTFSGMLLATAALNTWLLQPAPPASERAGGDHSRLARGALSGASLPSGAPSRARSPGCASPPSHPGDSDRDGAGVPSGIAPVDGDVDTDVDGDAVEPSAVDLPASFSDPSVSTPPEERRAGAVHPPTQADPEAGPGWEAAHLLADAQRVCSSGEAAPPPLWEAPGAARGQTPMQALLGRWLGPVQSRSQLLAYCCSYFFLKMVTYSLFFWLPLYLAQGPLALAVGAAARAASLFDLGFMAGGLLLGHLSDRLARFAQRPLRSPLVAASLLGALAPLAALRAATSTAPALLTILLAGVFLGGPAEASQTSIAVDFGKMEPQQRAPQASSGLRNRTARSTVDPAHGWQACASPGRETEDEGGESTPLGQIAAGERRVEARERSQGRSATMVGVIDAAGAFGAGTGQWVLLLLTEQFGWRSAFVLFMVACVASAACLVRVVREDVTRVLEAMRRHRLAAFDLEGL